MCLADVRVFKSLLSYRLPSRKDGVSEKLRLILLTSLHRAARVFG